MGYTPDNNPYIPGDPYSYDLKWQVDNIKHMQSRFAELDEQVQEATDQADRAEQEADRAVREADRSHDEADRADAEALVSEGYAAGTQDGEAVTEGPYFENNSKYYSEESAASAQEAADYAAHISDPVSGLVTAWLAANISQPTTPAVDASLSISGAAADAKVTGDKLKLINTISEKTDNLISYDPNTWADNADGTYAEPVITDDNITVQLLRAGTYLGINTIVDVSGMDAVTASWAGYSGTGAAGFRYSRSVDGQTWELWSALITSLPITIPVSGYNYLKFSLYAATTDSQTAGASITYEKVMLSEGNSAKTFIKNPTAIDSLARRQIEKYANEHSHQLGCILTEMPLENGYIDRTTGNVGNVAHYKHTDYILVENITHVYSNGQYAGLAGMAFYDQEYNFVSGSDFIFVPVPAGAYYVRVSFARSNDDFSNAFIRLYENNKRGGIINCIGDSVTEGMNMAAQGFATYHGDNYPSHLLKLLYDSDKDFAVNNYGASGEDTIAVCARAGGRGSSFFKVNQTFPAASSTFDITNILFSNFKNNDNYLPVNLSKGSYISEYMWISGHRFNVAKSGNSTFILKVDGENTDILLAGNDPITIGSTFYQRDADITIVYMGINDTVISMEQWIDRIRSIQELGSHVLVIGASSAIWTKFNDLSGDSSQKYYLYNAKCREAFGNTFLNLFRFMCTQAGIDIALAGGYLAGRTPEQIAADEAAINSGLTPPSLTLDGTAGNVHFNDAGYYVMAKLIFDKLNQLHWI